MSLTLFHSPGTRTIRPYWLLEEMGLEYQLKSYKYDLAYFASDEFRAVNPMGKLPALLDDGNLILESTVIMDYLLNRYPQSQLSVSPQNDEYATYLQWLHMPECGITHYLVVALGNKSGLPTYQVSDQFDAYCRFQVEKGFGMLEQRLSDREYILNQGFSAADISMGYTLFMAKVLVGIGLSPVVSNYFRRLAERPAYQKTTSDIRRPTT